jgi:hypothetical protein
MNYTPLPLAIFSVLALTFALGACSKPADTAAPTPVAAAQPAAAPAAPPPKPMKMVCRNSQTGANAECGSPNAVMVGMEPA